MKNLLQRSILIVLLSYFSVSTNAQNSNCSYENKTTQLGIGIVNWNSEKKLSNPFLELYNDPQLTQLYVKWIYYNSPPDQPVCTKFHKPDYGIVSVVCLEENKDFFKILINFDEVKYIPNNGNYQLEKWADYLQSSHGIRRKYGAPESIKHQSLRERPTPSAKEIQLPNERFELFCLSQIKGDWIEVIYDCFYNNDVNEFEGKPCKEYTDKCESPIKGWLKWRTDSEILIDIFTMP